MDLTILDLVKERAQPDTIAGIRDYQTQLQANKDATIAGTGLVGMAKNRLAADERNPRPWLEKAALASMPVPVVGDILGLASDAAYLAANDEARTPLNFGLSALGLLPFLPGMTSVRPAKWKNLGGIDAVDVSKFAPSDDAAEYVYHVTTKSGVEGIAEKGFKGGSGNSAFGGGYAGHSKNKVFFTDADGVEYWKNRIEEAYDAQGMKPQKLKVVRVKKDAIPDLVDDPAGGIAAKAWMVDSREMGQIDPRTGMSYIVPKAGALPVDEASRMARANAPRPLETLRVRPARYSQDVLEMGGVRGQKKSIQVLKNPTVADLKRNDAGSGFRHFRDADGNVYAWRADEAIHDQVTPMLNVKEVRDQASDVILGPEDMAEYYKKIDADDALDELDDPEYYKALAYQHFNALGS